MAMAPSISMNSYSTCWKKSTSRTSVKTSQKSSRSSTGTTVDTSPRPRSRSSPKDCLMKRLWRISARRPIWKERERSTTRNSSINCCADVLIDTSILSMIPRQRFPWSGPVVMDRWVGLIYIDNMESLLLRIEFTQIAFKVQSKRPFSIRLLGQTADGQQLRSEEVMITQQSTPTSLNQIPPFQFFLVAQGRACYTPFELYFIVNKVPTIKRKIPLQLLSIRDHQVNTQGGAPLQRIYAFQEGNILYNVRTIGHPKVMDPEQAQKYQEKLTLTASVNNSMIREPNITTKTSRVQSKPSFSIEDLPDKMQAQETKITQDDDLEGRQEGLSYQQSWNEFLAMESEHRQRKPLEIKGKEKSLGNVWKIIGGLILIGVFLLLAAGQSKERPIRIKPTRQPKKVQRRGGRGLQSKGQKEQRYYI